jgi:hypothetical protein
MLKLIKKLRVYFFRKNMEKWLEDIWKGQV